MTPAPASPILASRCQPFTVVYTMRWTVWILVAAILLAFTAWAAPAAADTPPTATPAPQRRTYKWTAPPKWSIRLSVKLGPGWGACARYGLNREKAEDRIQLEVGSHVAYDPFETRVLIYDDEPRTPMGEVTVKLSGTSHSIHGSAVWIGTSPVTGKPFLGHDRSIEGTDRYACTEILADIAFMIGFQFPRPELDPLPVCPAAPVSAAVPTVCADHLDTRYSIWPNEWPLPPLEKPKADPPRPPEPWPFALRLGASVWPELVANGWGSTGFAVDVGLRYQWASVNVEAHGDPPLGSVTYPQVGTVSFARVSGALLLCAHLSWFAACGVGDVGRFFFPAHVAVLPPSRFYGALGVRANLEFPVVPSRVFVHVGVDMRAPIPPASYVAGDATVFRASGPGVGLGIGLLTELPL